MKSGSDDFTAVRKIMGNLATQVPDGIHSARTGNLAKHVGSRELHAPRKDVLSTATYLCLVAAMFAAQWVTWPLGVSVRQVQAGMLVGVTLCAWAFGLMEEPLPTLTLFLLAILFKIAPPSVVFSGFSSTAWWLVLGGSVTGLAVKTTGLGQRIATVVFASKRHSYQHYLVRVAIVSVGLAFVMPSTTGRIMLLTPLVMALAESLGYERGSNGYTGMVLTVAACSFMPPSSILPANLTNTVLLGAADALYGIKLSYGPYLLLHFPVLGILKTMVIVWVVSKLFPEDRACRPLARSQQPPMSRQQSRLVWLLCVSVLMFATDFAHGISPAWIALGFAVICLWPGMHLVSTKSFANNVHITHLIYVAGFLCIGALVADSGIGLALGRRLLQCVPLAKDAPVTNLAMLGGIEAAIGFLTTLTSLPAVMTPLASDFSHASGLPLYTVLMVQVPIFSTVVLPYQCPPMMIAMGMGGVSIRNGSRFCLALSVITFLILLPLDMAWWRWLGAI